MLRNGTPAPLFELPTHSAERFSLSQTRGKVTCLLFVRGRFCPTTRKHLLAYEDFFSRMRELNVALVAVSCDTREDSQALVEQFALRFPILMDEGFVVSGQYGVYREDRKGRPFGQPALIIVDVDGNVAYSVISSGPKGLPMPGDVAPVLLYMHSHQGRY